MMTLIIKKKNSENQPTKVVMPAKEKKKSSQYIIMSYNYYNINYLKNVKVLEWVQNSRINEYSTLGSHKRLVLWIIQNLDTCATFRY